MIEFYSFNLHFKKFSIAGNEFTSSMNRAIIKKNRGGCDARKDFRNKWEINKS